MGTRTDLPLDAYGTFTVQTAAGTDFILELEGNETVVRRPGMRKPGTDTAMPGDFEPLPLAARSDIAVNHPAELSYYTGDDLVSVDVGVVTGIIEHDNIP